MCLDSSYALPLVFQFFSSLHQWVFLNYTLFRLIDLVFFFRFSSFSICCFSFAFLHCLSIFLENFFSFNFLHGDTWKFTGSPVHFSECVGIYITTEDNSFKKHCIWLWLSRVSSVLLSSKFSTVWICHNLSIQLLTGIWIVCRSVYCKLSC
jgi:hypothetical protein